MAKPYQGAAELLKFLVAVGKVVDELQTGWILPQTLSVVVHGLFQFALSCVNHSFLEPKIDAVHILDEAAHLVRVPF